MSQSRRWVWLLFPAGLVLWAAGYWGAWVPHKDVGLVILGIDLGEYVKFLPQVRSGQLHLWREGFYLPALALSVSISFLVWRRELPVPEWLRVVLTLLAFPPAFAMLPPVWTPALMLHSVDFRQQTMAIVLAVLAAIASPLLGRLHRRVAAVFLGMLLSLSAIVPLYQFHLLFPFLAGIYREHISVGYGIWLMLVSLAVLMGSCVWLYQTPSSPPDIRGCENPDAGVS